MKLGKPIDIDIRGDNDLLSLLQRAEPEELRLFVDYLTDKGEGRLALSNEVCATLVKAKAERQYSEAIIRELQHFGGNSIVNLFRSSGVPYCEIVFDVLEHLKGKRENGESLANIEAKVLKKLWGAHPGWRFKRTAG